VAAKAVAAKAYEPVSEIITYLYVEVCYMRYPIWLEPYMGSPPHQAVGGGFEPDFTPEEWARIQEEGRADYRKNMFALVALVSVILLLWVVGTMPTVTIFGDPCNGHHCIPAISSEEVAKRQRYNDEVWERLQKASAYDAYRGGQLKSEYLPKPIPYKSVD